MSTLEQLKEIMEEQDVGSDVEITPETKFEELGLDSLDFVDLTMSCEETFDIELDLEQAPKTIGELIEKIEALQGK